MNRIDLLVQQMIQKAKESFDKDIDEIKTILKSIGKAKHGDF